MIDINELRRLTQAATPGPWQILTITDEGDATFGTVYDDVDAKFIAAVNPATTSELLDRLEAAEKERDAYKSAYANWTAKTEWLQDEINSGKLPAKYLGMHRADGIKAEIDALRAKIEQMEQQEPVAWIVRGGYPVPLDKLEWQLWYGSEKPTLSWVNQETRPLYALPGTQNATGIPEGWKLMPIEPTTIMRQYAGSVEVGDSDIGRFVLSWDEIESIYAAMIDAAPEANP